MYKAEASDLLVDMVFGIYQAQWRAYKIYNTKCEKRAQLHLSYSNTVTDKRGSHSGGSASPQIRPKSLALNKTCTAVGQKAAIQTCMCT
jgi:hypothetical protein